MWRAKRPSLVVEYHVTRWAACVGVMLLREED
jgi:hypothetical protein